jgi:TrwC relaxase
MNFSKSISLLHGSIRENAARARDRSELKTAAWWDERDARFCEILQDANAAAMVHLQKWAGVTRTGYHGRQLNGRELGKWESAQIVGTSWLQGTSRDGDMHDHVHNPILPRVRTLSDGKWRATDTMAIRRQIPRSRRRLPLTSKLHFHASSESRGRRVPAELEMRSRVLPRRRLTRSAHAATR